MRLCAYDWPGNVRELQNVIERAAILARDGRLAIDLAGAPRAAPTDAPRLAPVGDLLTEAARRERDRAALAAALDATGGRVSGPGGAAELLGLKPTTLASRLKKFAIDPRSFKPRHRPQLQPP